MIENFGRCLTRWAGAARTLPRSGDQSRHYRHGPHRSLGSTLIFGVQLKWPTLSRDKRVLSGRSCAIGTVALGRNYPNQRSICDNVVSLARWLAGIGSSASLVPCQRIGAPL